MVSRVVARAISARPKERQTLAAFLQAWLEAARTSTRERSHDRYRNVVGLHILPALGHHKLSALRPDTIQAFYSASSASRAARRMLALFARAR